MFSCGNGEFGRAGEEASLFFFFRWEEDELTTREYIGDSLIWSFSSSYAVVLGHVSPLLFFSLVFLGPDTIIHRYPCTGLQSGPGPLPREGPGRSPLCPALWASPA
jgi:hypothetical protein